MLLNISGLEFPGKHLFSNCITNINGRGEQVAAGAGKHEILLQVIILMAMALHGYVGMYANIEFIKLK